MRGRLGSMGSISSFERVSVIGGGLEGQKTPETHPGDSGSSLSVPGCLLDYGVIQSKLNDHQSSSFLFCFVFVFRYFANSIKQLQLRQKCRKSSLQHKLIMICDDVVTLSAS